MLLRLSLARSGIRLPRLAGDTHRRFGAFSDYPFTSNKPILKLPTHNHYTVSCRRNNQHASRSSSSQESSSKQRANSLRPLTVLALCIPLGYALSWFNDANSSSTAYRTSDGFTKYILQSKTAVSSTSSIFTLVPASAKHTLDFGDPHEPAGYSNNNLDVGSTFPSARTAIWSVQIKQPMLQIARSYTLLPASPSTFPPSDAGIEHHNNSNNAEGQQLRFLIRKEYRGEVSGYLFSLPLGAEIEVRGPIAEAVLPSRKEGNKQRDSVVFLAGGTGIAPAMRVADILCSSAVSDNNTNLRILWACRRREDCIGGTTSLESKRTGWGLGGWWSALRLSSLGFGSMTGNTQSASTVGSAHVEEREKERGTIVGELHELQRRISNVPRNNDLDSTDPTTPMMAVEYFVDEENTFLSPRHLSSVLSGASAVADNPTSRKLIFVSGPDGFVEYWAGAKIWRYGHEVAGPLGGVLGNMNLEGWEVIKL